MKMMKTNVTYKEVCENIKKEMVGPLHLLTIDKMTLQKNPLFIEIAQVGVNVTNKINNNVNCICAGKAFFSKLSKNVTEKTVLFSNLLDLIISKHGNEYILIPKNDFDKVKLIGE